MLTATISLNIAPLPENEIWFANAEAWNNYWQEVAGEVELDPADTVLYVPIPYDNTLVFQHILIDNVDYSLVTEAQMTSLLSQLNALDAAFQDMRTQMRNAGFITNAQ